MCGVCVCVRERERERRERVSVCERVCVCECECVCVSVSACVCVCLPGVGVDPGVVHRRRDRCRYGAGADVSDDVQRLFERVIHAEHLVAALRLFSRLLHQTALIARRVQIRQQLRVDELLRLTHTQTREQSGLRKSFMKTLHALNKLRQAGGARGVEEQTLKLHCRQTDGQTDRQTHIDR